MDSRTITAQGASRGIFGSKPDVKVPQGQKPKVKVVTKKQEELAKEVANACDKFKEEFPLPSIYDAYGSVHLYWKTYVKENKPWEPANQFVQGQIQEFGKKKKDQEGQAGLWKRADDELKEIVKFHNEGTQVTGAKAKILAKILEHDPAIGFKIVQDQINSESLLVELQLNSLSQLMLAEYGEL
ncbi:hypothetical protein BGZ49_004723 [Haplosporangium sp. Z 27]|nr:hypothetical protein BGZ49_004723 [Haplosporangium sp. Z 27]